MTERIKRGDTNPPFERRLRDGNGEPVNVTGVDDIEFHMRDENFNVVVSDNIVGNVAIVDATSGKVEYDWQTDDTTDVGSYKAEFVVDFGADGIRSFPADDNYDVEIESDIDD